MNPVSVVINAVIFLVTLVFVTGFFRRDGKWDPEKGKAAFRYFTCQSNAFCAAAALLTGLSGLSGGIPGWIWTLKYMATAAVTVTMMTVLLFLGRIYGYRGLLKGPDLFMHLLTPLLALFSFCAAEKRGMSFATAALGMLPVMLYGSLYLYRTVLAPEKKRWDDFYAFNRNGKWPVSLAAMLAGTLLICLGIMALQNL